MSEFWAEVIHSAVCIGIGAFLAWTLLSIKRTPSAKNSKPPTRGPEDLAGDSGADDGSLDHIMPASVSARLRANQLGQPREMLRPAGPPPNVKNGGVGVAERRCCGCCGGCAR